MNRFAEKISAISDINEQLPVLLEEENFSSLSEQLALRLELLKKLDSELRSQPVSQLEVDAYEVLLKQTQALDAIQLPKVLKERGDVVDTTVKVNKGRSAVSLYQDISKR